MPIDPSLLVEAEAALQQYGDKAAAARALGISRETLRDRLLSSQRRARRAALRGEVGGPPIPEAGRPPEGFVVVGNSATYASDGRLLRQSVQTRPDSGEPFEVPEGHVVRGESALLDAEGRVVQRWVKTAVQGASQGLSEALLERFQAYQGAAPLIPAPETTDAELLVVYPLADLHIGMLAWGKENGGADWDIEIATTTILRTVTHLVAQSRPSKRAVVLGLGDLTHTNDQTNATPAHKHRLDVDGRFPKIYAAIAKLMTTIIDLVAQKHDEVIVVNVPGNHDPDCSITLTVALSLFYSNTPRIQVYDKPGLTWYHRFGKVLLGATHGHTIRPAEMAMAMATDCPQDWGATVHRHMMFGHLHHTNVKDIGPVKVEGFTTPAARDAHAHTHGYRSPRSMSAITFHEEHGEIGRHKVNLI